MKSIARTLRVTTAMVILFSLFSPRLLELQAQESSRRVAIILDTSSSMRDNDGRRYGVQLAQVISDLTNDGDQLTLIRFPRDGACHDQADRRLARPLNPTDRISFKHELDRFLRYRGGTHFAAPIRTAIQVLGTNTAHRRMLLIIADSGGLGACKDALTRELADFQASGAFTAAINLDRSQGAFERNPALDFTAGARDPVEMIQAVAQVYQRFLGAKQVQTGRVEKRIQVEIQPFCKEAFLVVVADGQMGGVVPARGNPGASSIDPDFRGGGSVTGLDRVVRQYRIVRLQRPSSGDWTFEVPGLDRRAAWMLLQDYSIGVRAVTKQLPAGAAVLEVELFDESTGRRIADLSQIRGLSVTVDTPSGPVRLNDSGAAGDRQARDGILSGTVDLGGPGRKAVEVKVSSDILDFSRRLDLEVVDSEWRLQARVPSSAVRGRPVLLTVRLSPAAPDKAPPRLPTSIRGRAPGLDLSLRDDGRSGDKKAGDGIFSLQWTPDRTGEVVLEFEAQGGSPGNTASARIRIDQPGWKLQLVGSQSFDLDYPGRLSVRLRPLTPGVPPQRPPSSIRVRGSGLDLRLNDRGRDGDQQSGDGVYSVEWTPDQARSFSVEFRGSGDVPVTPLRSRLSVAELGWHLESMTASQAVVGVALPLVVRAQPTRRDRVSRRPPESIQALIGDVEATLRDDGQGLDRTAGDLIYSASWTPPDVGVYRVDWTAVGGSAADTLNQEIRSQGHIELSGRPISIGTLKSGAQAEAHLDLSDSTVRGDYHWTVSSDLVQPGVRLEVFESGTWKTLGASPLSLSGPTMTWPLRFSVERCPQPSTADQLRQLEFVALAASGEAAARTSIPLRLAVAADSFWTCWWPIFLALVAAGVVGVAIHGYWWPARFPSRLGVVISQDEDIVSEGFFHPIKGEKGTRSGFYQHARCYVCSDYRLRGKPINGLAQLRAQRNHVLIQPVQGARLQRRTLDGEWEAVPPEEFRARFGVPFRDDSGSLYFEIRNG